MKGSGARRVGGRFSVERRNEILDVALAVLAERGYRDASMREIAIGPTLPKRLSTPGSGTRAVCSSRWFPGRPSVSMRRLRGAWSRKVTMQGRSSCGPSPSRCCVCS